MYLILCFPMTGKYPLPNGYFAYSQPSLLCKKFVREISEWPQDFSWGQKVSSPEWNEAQVFDKTRARYRRMTEAMTFDRIRLYGGRRLLNGQEVFGDLKSYELLFGGESCIGAGIGSSGFTN
jgi:hypothetical protein